MNNSINSRQPSCAGVNINCYTIDPTKLPPNHPLLQSGTQCAVSGMGPQGGGCCCYPNNYYTNNYGMPPYGPFPPYSGPVGPTKKKRVQVITDNYIRNLEAYLNSPSEDMRKYAAKEVLKRLDEDKSRYNDAALNALINKMLLDPTCHRVKAIALNALESQLAQGNDNTVKILSHMAQHDTSRNGADAASAANILLKMSSPTQLIDVPINNSSKGMVE